MDIQYIFDTLKIFQEIEYFEIILFIISYIYLIFPLPVTPLILFNSIYFQELAFVLNILLILSSYFSVYKLINITKLNLIIEKYIFSKLKKKIISINLNEFWRVFLLRIIIPIPLLNYYLAIKNYKLYSSLLATLLALIPYVFIISGTSKNMISDDLNLNFDYRYLILYIFYAISIFILSKLIQKIKSSKSKI